MCNELSFSKNRWQHQAAMKKAQAKRMAQVMAVMKKPEQLRLL